MRRMTHQDLIKHYGTGAAAARALRIDRRTVSIWRVRGIPELRQIQIEMVSKGALKAHREPQAA
jgi:hypothetical protein